MKARLVAQGRAFENGNKITAIVELLQGYGVAFDWCLKRSAALEKIEQPTTFKLVEIRSGSVDIGFLTDVAGAIAPIAPQLFGKAWDLYKSGYDLIAIVTRYLKREGRPMEINIANSPGAVVNIVNGDQVNTTREVFDFASKQHGLFTRLAALIKRDEANVIRIDPENYDRKQIVFDNTNKDDYDLFTVDRTEEAPIEFECSIYRFNKRSRKGALEYEDDGQTQVRPFTIEDHLYEACVQGFAKDTVSVTAYRKMEVNALGETKIKEFHLVELKLPD